MVYIYCLETSFLLLLILYMVFVLYFSLDFSLGSKFPVDRVCVAFILASSTVLGIKKASINIFGA